MRHARHRRKQGVSIAEAAAALALLLPLLFLVIFVVLEASYAYLIKNSLAQAAREAARDLAVQYGQDPSIAGSRTVQNTQVFDKIRINKIVADSTQFDDPVFATGIEPSTVTVTVHYRSGQFGLPVFPNPDPLKLGANFPIDATSTYRLE